MKGLSVARPHPLARTRLHPFQPSMTINPNSRKGLRSLDHVMGIALWALEVERLPSAGTHCRLGRLLQPTYSRSPSHLGRLSVKEVDGRSPRTVESPLEMVEGML